ncbi:MAG TPA: peptidylprolyl isomerase [Gemmatimonadota bacterium]|nr:peptidylprolyl isomerase [Gemmatimonadota bacterium]
MIRRRLTLALALLATIPAAAVAQEREVPAEPVPLPGDAGPAVAPAPQTGLEERILAIVGEELLLESEWREQTALLAGQYGVPPGTPEHRELAGETFDRMLQDLIIYAAARRDTTLQIDEDQVREAADAEIEQIRQRFPSEEAFQQELRQSQWGSLAGYRADLMERKRRELYGEAFLQTHRDEIHAEPVTDAEVRAFWDENRGVIGRRPETIRFEEIPVVLEPDSLARGRARERAAEVLAELQAGRDFEAVARQYSDDPGSRAQGGDLGWFSRGRMVPSFENVAFEAPTGELAGPVESPFGFHVLQVTDRRPDEVRARHVLIAFERTDADRQRARQRATELRDLIAAGADVDSLQAGLMPGDSTGAAVIELPTSQLPEVYAAALADLDAGEPGIAETATGFSVVVNRGRGGGGEYTFEEIAPRIRQQLAAQRAQEQFVERLREDIYVDIRRPTPGR